MENFRKKYCTEEGNLPKNQVAYSQHFIYINGPNNLVFIPVKSFQRGVMYHSNSLSSVRELLLEGCIFTTLHFVHNLRMGPIS
jgi:hypothetical protein